MVGRRGLEIQDVAAGEVTLEGTAFGPPKSGAKERTEAGSVRARLGRRPFYCGGQRERERGKRREKGRREKGTGWLGAEEKPNKGSEEEMALRL